MQDVLTTDDLRRILKYRTGAAIARCLERQGVKVFWGKDGPWTTLALINQAGGLTPASNEAYRPEDLV